MNSYLFRSADGDELVIEAPNLHQAYLILREVACGQCTRDFESYWKLYEEPSDDQSGNTNL